MPTPIRLYRCALSGHCRRVELFLSLLGLPFETAHVDPARRAAGVVAMPAFRGGVAA